MQHPAVIRARQGLRTVGVSEWLAFAFVLSVPPLRLLDPGTSEGLRVGGTERSSEDVRRWVHGVGPLPDLERLGVYYSTSGQLARPESSHFSSTLRALADQFDTATSERERAQIALTATSTATGVLQGLLRDPLERRRKATRGQTDSGSQGAARSEKGETR